MLLQALGPGGFFLSTWPEMMSLTAEYVQPSLQGLALEVRLARSSSDIEAAQRLRYQVFYEEMGAVSPENELRPGIDHDRFDVFCDHLLVIDPTLPQKEAVVGTYRLMPGSRLTSVGQFYSEGEFDLSPLFANGPAPDKLLECGRSCVAAGYRNSHTVQLLWRGIAAYMAEHGFEAMFGCASLAGTDARLLAEPLAWLRHQALAPIHLRVSPLAERAVDLAEMPAFIPDRRSALKALPPLIKAYLRLGAWVGDGAATDKHFDTTDVFILLPTNRIPTRYFTHFER